MIKSSALMALANRLQEEGVVGSTTDVEVSANVHVTPEEQEKIDEAVTQVEEIATAGQEIDEAVTEQEQTEEAEATLRAIVNNLKKYGSLNNQMYSFLQEAGYLDAISAYQSTQMNKVVYPAVEAIAPNQLNKAYMDSIIAGCEGMLKRAGQKLIQFLKNIWQKIVEFVQKVADFVLNGPGRIDTRRDSLPTDDSINIAPGEYSESLLGMKDMEKYAKVCDTMDETVGAQVEACKSTYSFMDKLFHDTSGADKSDFLQKMKLEVEDAAKKSMAQFGDKNFKVGGFKTLGLAGFKSVGDLRRTAYSHAMTCARSAKTIKAWSPTIKKILTDLDKQTAQTSEADMKNSHVSGMVSNIRQLTVQTQKGISTFTKTIMQVSRSYSAACAAALRYINKNNSDSK